MDIVGITYNDYSPDQKVRERERKKKDETLSLSTFLPGGQ